MASTFKRRSKQPSSKDASSEATPLSAGATTTNSISMLGLRGTKPWTGGTTLTSSGLRDLDGILGGGQPLGTCLLVEEDRWTNSLASSLVRYWCAEAVSHGQHLMIPTVNNEGDAPDAAYLSTSSDPFYPTDAPVADSSIESVPSGPTKSEVLEFLDTLPRNLHWEKQQKQKAAQEQLQQDGNASSNMSIMMETLEEDEDEEENDDSEVGDSAKNDEGLTIAWQYRKNVQRERLGHAGASSTTSAARSNSSSRSSASDIYCHSYDLSSRLSEQLQGRGDSGSHQSFEELVHLNCVQCCSSGTVCRSGRTCAFRLYQRLWTQLQVTLQQQPRKVVRLMLYHYKPEILCVALPLLLTQIRLKQLPVVVLVSVQPWKSTLAADSSHSGTLLSLQRASDVVLQTEGFAARSLYPPPPEFRHLHGLLLIRKVGSVTSATAIGGGHYADLTMSKRPPANIYGLKRDRRKLHIPLLHIPPEDHAEGGGSVGGGGVRSGAGRPAAASKPAASAGVGCGSDQQNSKLDF